MTVVCFWRRRRGGAVRSWLGGSAARGKRGSGPWMGGDPISVAMDGLRNEDRASLDRRVAASPEARRLAHTSQLAPNRSQLVVVTSDPIACDSERRGAGPFAEGRRAAPLEQRDLHRGASNRRTGARAPEEPTTPTLQAKSAKLHAPFR